MIKKEFIVDFVQKMKSSSDRVQPSFFEFTVVMALRYFADEKTDIAIIETGLGGRLDSTNVITPEVSIITNIGFDHMNILGDTLEKIAFEKAGIIKNNVPVVIGETIPETIPVFLSRASENNAPVIFAEKAYKILHTRIKNDMLEVELENIQTRECASFLLDLTGVYQQYNLRTVLTAVDQLRKAGYDLKPAVVRSALSMAKNLTGFHGRWEIIHLAPQVVLDVAHNEDGIHQMLNQLSLCTYNQLYIVFGIVKDKDAEKILSILPRDAYYYFTNAQIPRALPSGELIEKATQLGLKGEQCDEVNLALQSAIAHATPQDLIIVCGSVFVVGEVDLSIEKSSAGDPDLTHF